MSPTAFLTSLITAEYAASSFNDRNTQIPSPTGASKKLSKYLRAAYFRPLAAARVVLQYALCLGLASVVGKGKYDMFVLHSPVDMSVSDIHHVQ